MVKNQRKKSSKPLNEKEIYELLDLLDFSYADFCYCPNKAMRPMLSAVATENEKLILKKFGLPYQEKYLLIFTWDGKGFTSTYEHIVAQLHVEARKFLLSSPGAEDFTYAK